MEAPETDSVTTSIIKNRILNMMELNKKEGSFEVKADLETYPVSKYFPDLKLSKQRVSKDYYIVRVEF